MLTSTMRVFGAEVETQEPPAPHTIVSLVVLPNFPVHLGVGPGGSTFYTGLEVTPVMVEIPWASSWSLRLFPRVAFESGVGVAAQVTEIEMSASLPYYFRERDAAWSFRGGYAEPFLFLSMDPRDSESFGILGGAVGYGWQSDAGVFLLLGFGIGEYHQFHPHTDVTAQSDSTIAVLSLVLGYRLN